MMKLVDRKVLLETRIFTVTEDVVSDGRGFAIRKPIVQHPGAAVMLGADQKSRLLLIRQYRIPAGGYLWEVPAGRLDPGETPLQAAKRELQEETGYRARRWTRLCQFFPSPGCLAEKMTVFLARDLIAGPASPMEDERIESRFFPWRDVETMIDTGAIRDGKTIISFYRWKARRGSI
jgi:ADP-ribose pyrophosphatase